MVVVDLHATSRPSKMTIYALEGEELEFLKGLYLVLQKEKRMRAWNHSIVDSMVSSAIGSQLIGLFYRVEKRKEEDACILLPLEYEQYRSIFDHQLYLRYKDALRTSGPPLFGNSHSPIPIHLFEERIKYDFYSNGAMLKKGQSFPALGWYDDLWYTGPVSPGVPIDLDTPPDKPVLLGKEGFIMVPIEKVYPNFHGSDSISDYTPLIESIGCKILVKEDDCDYHEDSLCLLQDVTDTKLYGYLELGWGSCSSCDALQGCDTYEDLEKLRQELSLSIHWDSKERLADWLFESHDWLGTHLSFTLVHSFLEKVRMHWGWIRKKKEIAMDLNTTAEGMASKDYQERFKAEYQQLKIRSKKLRNMLNKMDLGELDFTPKWDYDLLHEQLIYMQAYLGVLERRANIEGINLLWLNNGAPADAS